MHVQQTSVTRPRRSSLMVKRQLPTEELHRYVKQTVCSPAEVKRLWERFCRLDKQGNGRLTREEVLAAPELQSNPFASRIVELCSHDRGCSLNFQELVDMFCIFHSRAPVEVKTAWAFAIWDFDGDDMLGASDLKQGLRLVANGSAADPLQYEDSVEESVISMFDGEAQRPRQDARRTSVHTELLSPLESSQILHRIAVEIEPISSGISFEEFEALVSHLPDFAANFRMNF